MRIGLVLNILDEEYQISVYKGVKKRAQELGIDVICFQQENTRISKNTYMGQMINNNNLFKLDGILLLTPVLIDSYEFVELKDVQNIWGKCPIVSVGQKIRDVTSLIVQTDDSMKQLVEHLILYHNYRNFLYLSGSQKHADTIQREEIFKQTVDAYKPWFPDLKYTLKQGWYNEQAAIQAMMDYYDENPDEHIDAVVCASDNMAIGVYKFFKVLPRFKNIAPCAVTGFDDIPQARFELPPLTTIHQPLEEMGAQSVDTLFSIIKKEKVQEDYYIESNLILRNSCGCPQNYEGDYSKTKLLLEQIQQDYVNSERLLRMLTHVGQAMNYAEDLEGLKYSIGYDMDQLNVSNFCVLSFTSNEMNVVPIYVRRNGKYFYEFAGNRELPLNEFYEKFLDFDENRPSSLVFKFLYTGVKIVGCILYDCADDHLPYLASMAVNIAQSINRIETLEERKRHSEYLEKEVSKRTQQLVEANNQRMKVEAEVLRISEIERQRFSTDLHDDICQRLAGISMLCRSYSNTDKPIEKEEMVELAGLISDTLQRTRQYAHNSYPVELESLGLNHSISNLCNSYTVQTGLKCDYQWEVNQDVELDKTQKLNIFRIVQEALHNVGKHARADNILVSIKSEQNTLIIQIADDGIGIKSDEREENRTGLGMNSMQYRANQIGATFDVYPNTPKGTVVEVKLDL